MDLAEIAKQFDDERTRAAAGDLAIGCGGVITEDRIDRNVAKTVDEWAHLLNLPRMQVYRTLVKKELEGSWRMVVAKDPRVSGRPRHFYCQTGQDPFLDD